MPSISRRPWVAVFLLILVLATASRFWGLGWGLPNTYHVDENWFAGKANGFLGGDLSPRFFHVPTLHMYTLAGLWWIYYQIEKAAGNVQTIPELQQTYYQSPGPFYLIGRALSALMGVLTILLLYLLGKRMFGPRAGAIAALILIFGLDHARISHDMLPDVPMVFFLVLGYLFIWNIAEKGRTRDYLWAGAAAGLAMTTKYGGLMLFIPLFIAHVYQIRQTKRPLREIILSPRLIGAGLLFLAVFLLGSPYIIKDFKTFLTDFKWQSSHLTAEGHYGDPADKSAFLFYLRYGFKENVGLIAQFFVLGGVLLGLLRRRKAEVILLAYPLVQFAMISTWKVRATRYLFPMAPFFALIAAFCLDYILRRGDRVFAPEGAKPKRQMLWNVAAGVLIAAVLAPSAVSLYRFDKALTGLDSRTRAKEWIDFNLPAGTTLAMEMYGPPISRSKYSIYYEHTLSKLDLDFLAFAGVEYAVTADTMAGRFLDNPDASPVEAAFYAALEREGTLVKTFEPLFKESTQELHMPELKIYRLSRAPASGFPVNFRSYVQSVSLQRIEGGWKVATAAAAEGGLGVGERPENLYLRISGPDGRELGRVVLKSGPLPVDGKWSAEASGSLSDLPEGAVVDLGYEYILAPNPISFPLDHPLRKEFRFPAKIDRAALAAGRWTAGFWFAAVPGPGGDYFETLSVIPEAGVPTLRTRIYGPSLRYGDSRIINPYVLVRDDGGKDLKKLTVFSGRLGALDKDTPGPAEGAFSLSGLPSGFRIFVGRDNGAARAAPEVPTGPALLELPPLPPLPDSGRTGAPNML